MTHRPRIATLAVALLILLIASVPACGKKTTNPGGGGGGNVFSPATVSVRTGSYVRWVNSSGVSHTVTRP
jgi:plastocyanin